MPISKRNSQFRVKTRLAGNFLPDFSTCLRLSVFQNPPCMGLSPRNMPPGTDGQAHLFFAGDEPAQLMAISTTGCIAIQSPDNPVRVFHWYYRAKGRELITLPPTPWIILWSCR